MRYFFDIFDGDNWARDDRGIECRDDAGARRQAVFALVEMAHDYIPANGGFLDLSVRIRDAAQVTFTVRLDFSTVAGPGLRDPEVVESRH